LRAVKENSDDSLQEGETLSLSYVLATLLVIDLAATSLEFLLAGLTPSVWLGIITLPVLFALLKSDKILSIETRSDLVLAYAFVAVGVGAWLQPRLITSTAAFLLVPTILGAILRRPWMSIVGSILLLTEWGYLQMQAGMTGRPLIREVSGLVTGLVLLLLLPYFRQIDYRKILHHGNQLKAQRDEVDALVHAVRDPIATLDAERRVVASNEAGRAFLQAYAGWNGQLGAPLPQGEGREALHKRMNEAGTGQTPIESVELARANQVHRIDVACIALRRPDNSIGGYCLVGHDVSDETTIARSVQAAKTNLLNAVVHELNSPLTPITLQLHLLQSERLGPLTPTQQHSLAMVQRNLERLHEEHSRLGQAIRDSKELDWISPSP
jgi:hypothetical protein